MIEKIQPVKDWDINKQLEQTSREILHYINQIKAQPDDFAHSHLKSLQDAIKKANDALVKYEFKKDHPPVKYDAAFDVLEQAINYLTQKSQMETFKAQKNESHEELATEIVVALNALQNLVSLLEDVRETTPIHGVDLRDETYKQGRRVTKATGDQFKDGKT